MTKDCIVVIGDIHQKMDRLDKILTRPDVLAATKVIFLGDYFDSFDDEHQFQATVKFLDENLNDARYTFLLGNHDLHYLSDNPRHRCSGYEAHKYSYIKKHIRNKLQAKIKIFEFLTIAGESVLFSHAGLHPTFLPNCDDMLPGQALQRVLDKLSQLNYTICDPLLEGGADRLGTWARQLHGGILWMDWNSLIPIPNLHQVVGHSPLSRVDWRNEETSKNINIDTNLRYFMRIDLDSNGWEVVQS